MNRLAAKIADADIALREMALREEYFPRVLPVPEDNAEIFAATMVHRSLRVAAVADVEVVRLELQLFAARARARRARERLQKVADALAKPADIKLMRPSEAAGEEPAELGQVDLEAAGEEPAELDLEAAGQVDLEAAGEEPAELGQVDLEAPAGSTPPRRRARPRAPGC